MHSPWLPSSFPRSGSEFLYNNLGNVAENVKHCFCRCRLFAKERGLQQCPGFSVLAGRRTGRGPGIFCFPPCSFFFLVLYSTCSEERFAGECCEIAKRRAFYQPDAAPRNRINGDTTAISPLLEERSCSYIFKMASNKTRRSSSSKPVSIAKLALTKPRAS